MIYPGPPPERPVRLTLFDYGPDFVEEREVSDEEACRHYLQKASVTWINVDGVHDVELVGRMGRLLDIHPLTLEDIVHTRQRPKMEEYPSYVYVVLQMLHYSHPGVSLESEQVSLIIGDRFLVSFQESKEGDVFEPVRKRLREGRSRLRTSGADYLAYALMDVVVDYYMNVLEGIGEHIEALEDSVMRRPHPALLRRINMLRRHIIFLRRSIWPLRDVLAAVERSDLGFMSPETDVFFRDVYDHTVRTAELIESQREIIATLVELYLSTVSNRMNEIMKVLTIIATFFLPLTFIVGIYGMNFNPAASPLNMPELNWYFGYPFAIVLLALTALGMYVFFKRKGWF
jgi:magnesium transporter